MYAQNTPQHPDCRYAEISYWAQKSIWLFFCRRVFTTNEQYAYCVLIFGQKNILKRRMSGADRTFSLQELSWRCIVSAFENLTNRGQSQQSVIVFPKIIIFLERLPSDWVRGQAVLLFSFRLYFSHFRRASSRCVRSRSSKPFARVHSQIACLYQHYFTTLLWRHLRRRHPLILADRNGSILHRYCLSSRLHIRSNRILE
jgi:hypothetical protein